MGLFKRETEAWDRDRSPLQKALDFDVEQAMLNIEAVEANEAEQREKYKIVPPKQGGKHRRGK